MENLDAALEEYETGSEWFTETALELARGGVESLRAYVENPDDPDISWAAPSVGLQYAVDWPGPHGAERDGEPFFSWEESWSRRFSETLRPEDLETAETAEVAGLKLFHRHRHLFVFRRLTCGIAEWREEADGGEERVRYVLPDELSEALAGEGLEGEELTAAVLELARPFDLGDAHKPTEEDEAPETRDYLAATFPDLHFEVTTEAGASYAGGLFLRFHPLVLDRDNGQAFYPLEVALSLDEKADPAAWTGEDRAVLWDALSNALQPKPLTPADSSTIPSPRVVPHRLLLEGQTRMDTGAAALVSALDGLRLPRKWGGVRRWEELEREEIDRLQEEHGDAAFEEITTGPNPRKSLLVRRYKEDGEVVTLGRDAEESLLATVGPRGFRRVYPDKDGVHREYFVRRFQAGQGYAEVRLSWYGTASLLVEEAREKEEAAALELRKALDGQIELFEELDTKTQTKLDSRLRWLQAVKDGRKVMDYVLRVFGNSGLNPVHVPAWNLRTLLECENEPNGHARVEGCLEALRRLDFHFRSAGIPGQSGRAFGSFLSDVVYVPKGHGKHTDGDFYLGVSELFVGSLRVFNNPSYKLNARELTAYDWSKKLDADVVGSLRGRYEYVRQFSTLLPHYDRAKGFTDTQGRFVRFVTSQLTRKKDGARKDRKALRVKANAKNTKEANEPREYRRDFCPLLEDGRTYYAGLGQFSHNAETGRKLAGTGTRATKTGGARHEGLLAVMGYELPPGRASIRRVRVLHEAVADMRAVVEDALGGVVAAYFEDRWVSADEALELPAKELAARVRWFPFVPEDWRERLARDLEKYHAERKDRGEVDYLVEVTTDRDEYERSNAERTGEKRADATEGEPLRHRLHRERKLRGLRQADVARVFGVGQAVVARWEHGTAPDENGKVRGKPIPDAVVPLLVRWLDTGQKPTSEELAGTRIRSEKARQAASKRASGPSGYDPAP